MDHDYLVCISNPGSIGKFGVCIYWCPGNLEHLSVPPSFFWYPGNLENLSFPYLLVSWNV